jgi:hypothetical protein
MYLMIRNNLIIKIKHKILKSKIKFNSYHQSNGYALRLHIIMNYGNNVIDERRL